MATKDPQEASGAGDDFEQDESPRKTWLGTIWDTFDLPPRERKLMFKVDAALLSFACVSIDLGATLTICFDRQATF